MRDERKPGHPDDCRMRSERAKLYATRPFPAYESPMTIA
ncbi:hypothetical protein BLA13014_02478 [Burkholderia aenigmatica]|uniref:Uncharacterized protein n=1 Tax=Burkholderia aenigmatica TaxID=2015348 RepID=A0A6P2KF99_9BURK|nr:hypothetical protein BLA13014_02478 [Burkholderia aenigmatica]